MNQSEVLIQMVKNRNKPLNSCNASFMEFNEILYLKKKKKKLLDSFKFEIMYHHHTTWT